jgi:undecaprenyl diphosphate synthase
VELTGGSGLDWLHLGVDRWRWRLTTFAKAMGGVEVPWLTLRPAHDPLHGAELDRLRRDLLDATEGELDPCGAVIWRPVEGVGVVVDPDADGQSRFAAAIQRLRIAGVGPDDLDEARLAPEVLAPVGIEPDLVVVLGPPDQLPPSLVWELAYAELVFLDLPWADVDATHLQLAVDDYRRRDRRFGGIDA